MAGHIEKTIAERLTDIVNAAVDAPNGTISTFPAKVFNIAAGRWIALVGEAYYAFYRLCNELRDKRDWAGKFSDRFFDRALTDVLARVLSEGSSAKLTGYVQELVVRWRAFSEEQIVLVVVDGLRLEQQELQLGRVTLRHMTEAYLDQRVQDAAANFAETNSSAEERDKFVVHRREILQAHLGGKVCMEYRVVADPERAQDRALTECRRTLDVIRYALPFLYPWAFLGSAFYGSDEYVGPERNKVSMTEAQKRQRGERRNYIAVGLRGELVPAWHELACMAAKGGEYHYTTRVVGPYPHHVLLLNAHIVGGMRAAGVLEIFDIMASENINEFEKMTLRGVHWFSNALTQIEEENELLSLVTVLETFLTPGQSGNLTNTIAEGVAFILADSVEERLRLQDRVTELYKLRSAVSHGGISQITGDDLDELTSIAMQVLSWMVQHRGQFKQAQDLKQWLRLRKFGGS